jgi:plastocyanin
VRRAGLADTAQKFKRRKEQAMKRLIVILAGLALLASLAAGGLAATTKAPQSAKINIRHQMRGCHTWSVNGGTYRATLSTSLARGGTITFTNNDVMPHKLVKTSGPAINFAGKPNMNHMSASVKVTFTKAGVYKLTTKAGEDYAYMKGMKTIGEDNVLRLTVRVS